MRRFAPYVMTLACAAAGALLAPSAIHAQQTSGHKVDARMGLQRDATLATLIREISPAEMRATTAALVGFGTRHTMSDTMSATRGVGAARRYLHERFASYSEACGGCLRVEYDPAMIEVARHPRKPTVNVVNVLAWLPGRDTSRVVIISGHYDSCICAVDPFDTTSDAPGADDDASGTAAVLELARVFSQSHPKGLDATILFAAVAGEEQGLLGSTHLARRLHDAGIAVAGDMSDDIIGNVTAEDGRTDSTTMRIYSADPDNSPSREIARYAGAVGQIYNPAFKILQVFRVDRIGRGTDHMPFVALGQPGIRTTERMEALSRQHSPRDEIQYVNFGYAANIARLNAAVIGSLASAPAAPDSVRARRQQRAVGQWALSWKPVPGAKGYEILVRSTTSPTWERVIPVGDVSTYMLNEQLDDLWAGVRSVGANGHRSLAVAVPAAPVPPSTRR